MRLLASGATNSQIASALVVSDNTVKSHIKRILRKLPAANRAEAVYRYTQLAGPGEPRTGGQSVVKLPGPGGPVVSAAVMPTAWRCQEDALAERIITLHAAAAQALGGERNVPCARPGGRG